MERVTYRQTGAVSREPQSISNKQFGVRISLFSGGKTVSGECESPQWSRPGKAAADLTINTRGNNNANKQNLLCVEKSSLKVKIATSVIRILERNLGAPKRQFRCAEQCWGDLGPYSSLNTVLYLTNVSYLQLEPF